MYMCACVEGVAIDLQRVWRSLTMAPSTLAGLKTLEMADQDALMNPFGALLEVKVSVYTEAHRKR